MSTEAHVRAFFQEHSTHALPADRQSFLEIRYLDEGLIDSLGIIMMINELEQKCGVHFAAEDLESYEFQSIGGLIGVIDRLKSGPT